jgi:teichoic acid transport system permease protein
MPLPAYLREVWRRRDLAMSIARNDQRARHGTLTLGWVWNILDPLLLMGVYWLVFGLLLGGRRPDNFLAFLAVGMFLFRFVQGAVESGAESIQRHLPMVQQVRFPRALLPLSEVIRHAMTLAWQLPVMLAIVLVTTRTFRFSGWLLFFILLMPLAAMLALGLALLLSRVVAQLRDVMRLLPYLFRILFYGSGVLFPLDMLLKDHPLEPYLILNPLYVLVELARHLTLAPRADAPLLWVLAVAWAAGGLTIGLLVFRKFEHRLGRG